MSRPAMWRVLFGKIAPEAVDWTIQKLAKTWYGVAAFMVLIDCLVWAVGVEPPSWQLATLQSAFACALGGYFLNSRKSRTVAILQLGFAVVTGVVGARTSVGAAFLPIILIVVGWRGVRATWAHHRSSGSRTAWIRVTVIASLAATTSLIAITGLAMFRSHGFLKIESNEIFGTLLLATIEAVLLLILVPLTRRYPFAIRNENVAEVAKVFD